MKKFLLSAAALAAALALPAQAQTEVTFWHSMSGALGEWVNGLANDFNASQKTYKVVPVFKGTYPESMSAAIAAFRAGNAPHVLQVFEVGTATMMASKGAIKPVAQVKKEAGIPFDPASYVPAVAGYYTAPNGQMLSLPFNSSTTVFHYNKDAFKAAGLDPEKPPTTWPEVVRAAATLKANGHKCPFTTSWVSWTQLESFSAWHNVEYATLRNGFNGLGARLIRSYFDGQKHALRVTQTLYYLGPLAAGEEEERAAAAAAAAGEGAGDDDEEEEEQGAGGGGGAAAAAATTAAGDDGGDGAAAAAAAGGGKGKRGSKRGATQAVLAAAEPAAATDAAAAAAAAALGGKRRRQKGAETVDMTEDEPADKENEAGGGGGGWGGGGARGR